jgi:acetyl-CoA acyltransferase
MGKGRAATPDRSGGALSGVHPVELLGQVLTALVERTSIDAGAVEDVITGCVNQVGEQAGPVGRWAWLGAGLPEHVPSTTINRACGSSQQAVEYAAAGIAAGLHDIVIACGVESMSRVPIFASYQGQDYYGPSVAERYHPGLVSQGVSAELLAQRWKLSRDELDQFAAASHRRAATADVNGHLVAIRTPGRLVVADETVRAGTTLDSLAGLQPAFVTDEYRARFPDIEWKVTAGNASQITDGAAAMLLMSEATAQRLGLRPRARIVASAVVADDPLLMLGAPIPATEKVLDRAGLRLPDIEHYEINEAFASVPLAWQSRFDADPARLNPYGGAIALGHPLGASGLRLMATMLAALEANGCRYGLQVMCEGGGMANATIIERL